MGFWGNGELVSASGTGVLTWTSLSEDLLFLETIYTIFFLSFSFFRNDPSKQRPDKKTFTDTQLNSNS